MRGRGIQGERIEGPHSSHGPRPSQAEVVLVDGDPDVPPGDDPVEDESEVTADALDESAEPGAPLVPIRRDHRGTEPPPADDGPAQRRGIGHAHQGPLEDLAHLTVVEALHKGGLLPRDAPADGNAPDGPGVDVEGVGLAQGGGLQSEPVVAQVRLAVVTTAGEGHGCVNAGLVHAVTVVDDEHAGDVVVIGEDADANLRGACVDGVVDKVGERRGELVMGSQGVRDGRVGRNGPGGDRGDVLHGHPSVNRPGLRPSVRAFSATVRTVSASNPL